MAPTDWTAAAAIERLRAGDLSADVRKVIEPMKSGEITPLIRTSRGFQFFKVETVTASETVPFEQAREQINERVIGGKRKDEFDKYLTKLKAQAIIEWKNEDVKKAYEEGLAAQAAQAAQAKPATSQSAEFGPQMETKSPSPIPSAVSALARSIIRSAVWA